VDYERAKKLRAQHLVDEMMELVDATPNLTRHGDVDSGDVAHMRLRHDARRWVAKCMFPEQFGERVAVAGDKTNPLTVQLVSSADDILKKLRKVSSD
jgi:hypothetical protein